MDKPFSASESIVLSRRVSLKQPFIDLRVVGVWGSSSSPSRDDFPARDLEIALPGGWTVGTLPA